MRSSILIHPEELNKKWIDRIADNGIGILGLHPRGGGDAVASLAELELLFENDTFRELIDYAVSRGLEIEYEIHAARSLLPSSLFDAHPEYFRMNERGERVPDFNLCVSSEEALDTVAKNAATLAKKLYKSRPVYYFWLDDTLGAYCNCPRCKALSPSDQELTAVNRMLKEIRKTVPNAKMAYLAYQDFLPIPGKIKPADGIFLEYAPFEKYRTTDPERIRAERDVMKGQMEYFGVGDSKVLEYWLDNSLFSNWKKPPVRFEANKEQVIKEIREYAALGFESIATFGCFLGDDYETLYGEPDISSFTDGINSLK